ncbi:MAG: hypothetical protein RSB19_06060 [Erysipelotrichaceae bacterium]
MLYEMLNEIEKKHKLSSKLLLRVICTDGDIVDGFFAGYTDSIDNEPEITELEIITTYGQYTGISETEIKEIKVIENAK